MTWPTVAVNTTNVDQTTDSPATARTDLLDALQKLNAMIAQVSVFMGGHLADANAAAARTTLGAAASGANSDITSLSNPAIAAATATTATAADSSTKVATTAFVQGELTSQAVKLTGAQTVAGIKTFSSQPVLPQVATIGSSVATTSGTAIDFTGIPSWAKRVTILLNQVSTNGTNHLLLQLGAGSAQTTGYTASTSLSYGTGTLQASLTSGFISYSNAAVNQNCGAIVFTLTGSNTWVCSGAVSPTTGQTSVVAGIVTLSGSLDRVRLTTVGATDAFDGGSSAIYYE
jgi:hypothetical protein